MAPRAGPLVSAEQPSVSTNPRQSHPARRFAVVRASGSSQMPFLVAIRPSCRGCAHVPSRRWPSHTVASSNVRWHTAQCARSAPAHVASQRPHVIRSKWDSTATARTVRQDGAYRPWSARRVQCRTGSHRSGRPLKPPAGAGRPAHPSTKRDVLAVASASSAYLCQNGPSRPRGGGNPAEPGQPLFRVFLRLWRFA
ncbi:MAG: hypothetical protein QOG96_1209 [Pseudonocardiales bacterium]|nr:hypothetical protein [Pseudonocardiales bacterium]